MRMSSVRLLPVAAGLWVLVAIAAVAARPGASQAPSDPSGLEKIGRSHSVRGEYLLAIPLLRRACALHGEDRDNDLAAGSCLEALAIALIHTSQFKDAESVLKRAQARQEASSETNPLPLSRTLALVALLQRWMGQYDNSVATLDRALSLRKGQDLDSDDRVMLALLKGDLLWLAGDIPAALRQYESATALPRSSVRESLDHLVARRRQAFAEDHLGNSARAAMLADQADQAGAALLADCHDERGALLNDRAAIAGGQGDYSRARELYQRALTHKTRCAPVNGADVVTPLLNLALVAEATGDAREADELYGRAVQAWSARYGATHPFVAVAVDGLAHVSLMQGSPHQARQRWLRALNIRRRALGDDHPDVAWTFTNLGQTDILLGNIKAAATSLERSAEIYRRAGVSDQPDRFIRHLAARGELQLKLGNFSGAHDLLAEALATRLRFFGDAHPLSAEARADLARAQALVGRQDLALESALIAEDVAKNHLRRSISYLPERQALMYAGVRPEGLNLAVSIAASGHKSPRMVFDAVVRSRAVVLDELETRSQVKSTADPNLDKLRERL